MVRHASNLRGGLENKDGRELFEVAQALCACSGTFKQRATAHRQAGLLLRKLCPRRRQTADAPPPPPPVDPGAPVPHLLGVSFDFEDGKRGRDSVARIIHGMQPLIRWCIATEVDGGGRLPDLAYADLTAKDAQLAKDAQTLLHMSDAVAWSHGHTDHTMPMPSGAAPPTPLGLFLLLRVAEKRERQLCDVVGGRNVDRAWTRAVALLLDACRTPNRQHQHCFRGYYCTPIEGISLRLCARRQTILLDAPREARARDLAVAMSLHPRLGGASSWFAALPNDMLRMSIVVPHLPLEVAKEAVQFFADALVPRDRVDRQLILSEELAAA